MPKKHRVPQEIQTPKEGINYYSPDTRLRRGGRRSSTPTIDSLYYINGKAYKMVEEPKAPPLQLRPGVYRTKSGEKARVFIVNPEGAIRNKEKDYMVIGAVEIAPGYWEPRSWNYEGWTRLPYGRVNDIVGEWSEG